MRRLRLFFLLVGLMMSHQSLFAGAGWHGYQLGISTNHTEDVLEVSFQDTVLLSLVRIFTSLTAAL